MSDAMKDSTNALMAHALIVQRDVTRKTIVQMVTMKKTVVCGTSFLAYLLLKLPEWHIAKAEQTTAPFCTHPEQLRVLM